MHIAPAEYKFYTMLRILPSSLINRIAAGEVLERPSSAVKELVENALDANATRIEVILADGGKASLTVIDNGDGMTADELALCTERHATSKLPNDDLFDIDFLGFRGEAIPSIASVSRMTIASRKRGSDTAWQIHISAGEKSEVEPSVLSCGTKIEVKDLFFSIPARLKFLKSSIAETSAIKEIIDRLSMAYPKVEFILSDEKKERLHYTPCDNFFSRVCQILGDTFGENMLPISVQQSDIKIIGSVSLPTLNCATSAEQFFFVNRRPVRDKVLLGAIKAAYRELIPSDRFPALVLFIDVPKLDVDMNVHPTKAEIRFRNPSEVRGIIISAIKQAILSNGCKTSSSLSEETLSIAKTDSIFQKNTVDENKTSSFHYVNTPKNYPTFEQKKSSYNFQKPLFTPSETYSAKTEPVPTNYAFDTITETESPDFPPLGLAKAQLHETYIVSQTADGIIIVDQHAAHERLTYEKIHAALFSGQADSQYLLMPETVELGEEQTSELLKYQSELAKTGLIFDGFGNDAIIVRAIPAILGKLDPKQLITDIAQTIFEQQTLDLSEKIKNVVARMACHNSVRAGKKLSIDEMNALLRSMEQDALAGQCIHGRPTYIELKLKDIEKLFGRRE